MDKCWCLIGKGLVNNCVFFVSYGVYSNNTHHMEVWKPSHGNLHTETFAWKPSYGSLLSAEIVHVAQRQGTALSLLDQIEWRVDLCGFLQQECGTLHVTLLYFTKSQCSQHCKTVTNIEHRNFYTYTQLKILPTLIVLSTAAKNYMFWLSLIFGDQKT